MNLRILAALRTFRRLLLPLIIVLTGLPSPASAADPAKPLWEQSGDILQWGIPLVGLGLSFVLDSEGHWSFGGNRPSLAATLFDGGSLDASASLGAAFGWPGPDLNGNRQHDFIVSFARMEVATYALKYAIDARRPNGGGQSFPSGHTAAAFMGAEFIRKEYGPWWAVPAYGAAAWVGYTRVRSHNHYWRDVIGGAALGILSNHDFGTIEASAGTLSVSPTLMMADETLWERPDPFGDAPSSDFDALPVPGLSLKWTF